MTTATIGAGIARGRGSLVLARHPELPAAAIVAGAWVGLILMQLGPSAGSAMTMTGDPGMAEMPGMSGMPGMTMVMRPGADAGVWSAVANGLPMWTLMAVAMMGPAALAGVRHTSLNSLCWRRRRAMVEYGVAYAAVWTAYGVVVLAVSEVAPVGHAAALPVVLLGAAGWQFTRYKRRALRACHRATPLAPRGWRAEVAAVRFGAVSGAACVASCWCVMLLMVVSNTNMLLVEFALAGALTTERLLERPRAWTRRFGWILAVAALGVAAANS